MCVIGATAGDVNGVTPHEGLERETSDPADRGGGGKEMVDGVKEKRGKKRPLSGYYLPESIPDCDFVTDLGHEDDRSIHTHIHHNLRIQTWTNLGSVICKTFLPPNFFCWEQSSLQKLCTLNPYLVTKLGNSLKVYTQ